MVNESFDQKGFSLSVFFPCYNEVGNLSALVENTMRVVKTITDDFQVIIVDDGSTDGTYELALELCEKYSELEVVHHDENQGYGMALRSGFKAAKNDLIFYTDGDGQFDVSKLPAIMPYIEKYDIVSCYRKKRQDSFLRKLNAFLWGNLVCLLFRIKIRDIDCAFKLYRREIFDNIEMKSTGALIDTEILARAIYKGYTVYQLPVQHLPRLQGQQTGAKLSVILRAFKELFKLRKTILDDNRNEKSA